MASFDVDVFTKPFQLTKSMHRQLYPSLEPSNPNLKASGKVVLITGAGGTLGGVSMARSIFFSCLLSPFQSKPTSKRWIGHCVRMEHGGRGRNHSRRPRDRWSSEDCGEDRSSREFQGSRSQL